MRRAVITIGFVIAALGVLFMLQGLGVVHWPRSSFMLDQRPWVDRGAAVAVLGLLVVLAGRRLMRR